MSAEIQANGLSRQTRVALQAQYAYQQINGWDMLFLKDQAASCHLPNSQ